MNGTIVRAGFSADSALLVKGSSPFVFVEFTRAANTTAYAVEDVVSDGTILEFEDVAGANNDNGYIVKAILGTDQFDSVAGFKLHLFSVAPDLIADNAPFVLNYEDLPNYIGCIQFDDLTPRVAAAGVAYSINKDVRLEFQTVLNTSLFGVLETDVVFNPASGQKFFIGIGIEQN